MTVQFKVCNLFKESALEKRVAPGSVLDKKFKEFQEVKSANPMQPFGASDKLFKPDGNFGKKVKGIAHAHLTHDISIVYALSGRNPHIIRLWGFFSHDDLGTGQPPNDKIQKSMATKFDNQSFA